MLNQYLQIYVPLLVVDQVEGMKGNKWYRCSLIIPISVYLDKCKNFWKEKNIVAGSALLFKENGMFLHDYFLSASWRLEPETKYNK